MLPCAGNVKSCSSFPHCDNKNVIRDRERLGHLAGIPFSLALEACNALGFKVDIGSVRLKVIDVGITDAYGLNDGAKFDGAHGGGGQERGEEEKVARGDDGDGADEGEIDNFDERVGGPSGAEDDDSGAGRLWATALEETRVVDAGVEEGVGETLQDDGRVGGSFGGAVDTSAVVTGKMGPVGWRRGNSGTTKLRES